MKKNDNYHVIIEDISVDGQGVARVDNQVVFVPYTCKGEECDIQIINTKTKFAIGKIVKIYNQSKDRVDPPCPYFYQCGGCDIQHMNYECQLKYKQSQLETTLNRIGGITAEVKACVPSKNELHYRNKFAFPIVCENGKTILGMYRKNSHKIVAIKDCLIQEEFVGDLISITNSFIKTYKITGYDEIIGKGILRHLVCRSVDKGMLITLVATTKNVPHIDEYVKLLKNRFENFGLEVNVNAKNTNVIMGEKSYPIYGLDCLEVEDMGLKYSINNFSFMQVNNDIKDKIYQQVLGEVNQNQFVFDLYSGAGVLTALLAKNAKKVYGVEIVESAINTANKLMKDNHIDNVENICGDCSTQLLKLKDIIKDHDSMVVFDPPRKGLSEIVSNTILEVTPNKIVYISCNPATLARDLKILTEKYEILSITPYDMFPQTKHLESVSVLKLR